MFCCLFGCFLGIESLDFSEFRHLNLMKWTKNKPKKIFFLNLKKNLVIDFLWICSIMKIYIICCVLAQNVYWEKSCSWDVGQSALKQSHCRIFKSTIYSEQIIETASFFACWWQFAKIKRLSKIFWLGKVKNDHGLSVHKILKSEAS